MGNSSPVPAGEKDEHPRGEKYQENESFLHGSGSS
jgi:hypothetical protein